MTEMLIFLFNRDFKPHLKPINQCLRLCLVEKNDGSSDRNFSYGKVLSMLGTLIVKEKSEKIEIK